MLFQPYFVFFSLLFVFCLFGLANDFNHCYCCCFIRNTWRQFKYDIFAVISLLNFQVHSGDSKMKTQTHKHIFLYSYYTYTVLNYIYISHVLYTFLYYMLSYKFSTCPNFFFCSFLSFVCRVQKRGKIVRVLANPALFKDENSWNKNTFTSATLFR